MEKIIFNLLSSIIPFSPYLTAFLKSFFMHEVKRFKYPSKWKEEDLNKLLL